MDFVGPEQVSPHYENFVMSRKWALFLSGGFVTLNVLGNVVDLHWIMASAVIPFFYWMMTSYWTIEGRSSLVMPLLNRFYYKLAEYEMELLKTYWVDNAREQVRANMAEATEQMDYYQVHTSYDSIKAESINRFLANEQVNLKVNIYERAQALLESAQQMENTNQRTVINNIVSETVAAVEQTLVDNEEYIKDQMFESALLGIRSRQMTYENDPILPLVQKAITEQVQKVTSLSEEEQLALVTLSQDQLDSLRAVDERAKLAYLNKQPVLDGSLKAHESVQNALNNWGQ